MTTTALIIPHQFIVQFDSGIRQYPAPVNLSKVENVINEHGQSLYQPTITSSPMAESTMTPELLEALNIKLQAIGYKLVKDE